MILETFFMAEDFYRHSVIFFQDHRQRAP